LSKNKRKYSPDPIVRVTVNEKGGEDEEIVLIPVMKKAEAEKLSRLIINQLNQDLYYGKH
jgi:hypothetical protein